MIRHPLLTGLANLSRLALPCAYLGTDRSSILSPLRRVSTMSPHRPTPRPMEITLAISVYAASSWSPTSTGITCQTGRLAPHWVRSSCRTFRDGRGGSNIILGPVRTPYDVVDYMTHSARHPANADVTMPACLSHPLENVACSRRLDGGCGARTRGSWFPAGWAEAHTGGASAGARYNAADTMQ